MEVNVHDILYVKSMEDIQYSGDRPAWVMTEHMSDKIAVVRRMKTLPQVVPIGFRGNDRTKRFAAITPQTNIQRIIRPTEVIHFEAPESHATTMAYLREILRPYKWGIGGSVGFTMATTIPVCHAKSDLDVIIYCDQLSQVAQLKEVFTLLQKCTQTIDIQVELAVGAAVKLEDYLVNDQFILRTATGPILMSK